MKVYLIEYHRKTLLKYFRSIGCGIQASLENTNFAIENYLEFQSFEDLISFKNYIEESGECFIVKYKIEFEETIHNCYPSPRGSYAI